MEKALAEFGVHKDSGLLLATIRGKLDDEGAERVVPILLRSQYNDIVYEIGWELLMMFVSQLKSRDSLTYSLLCHIAKIGNPKEMCLAFLESMEGTFSMNTFTALLQPLRIVLDHLLSTKLQYSTLMSVRTLLIKYCIVLKMRMSKSIGLTEDITKQHLEDQDEFSCIQIDDVTSVSLTLACLDLLSPSLHQIHQLFCDNCGLVDYIGWSPLQQICNGILLDLLDVVMVCNMNEEHVVVAKVIENIRLCHCGALQLLEWKKVKTRRRLEEEEEDIFSIDGLAHLCCILVMETDTNCYLPCVLSHEYRLQLSLPHVNELLTKYGISHDMLSKRAVDVLDYLLNYITPHSLSSHLLDIIIFKKIFLTICNVMISSLNKHVRQKCVSLLTCFMDCFDSRGRYKLYDILLHEIKHTGICGLLIHSLKEEVNSALTLQTPGSSCFIGSELKGLYQSFLIVSEETDILSEFDEHMAALNFIRFLLLKDDPSCDKTFIWAEIDTLRKNYLNTLEKLVLTFQMYCKSLLNNPEELNNLGERQRNSKYGPEVFIDVVGDGRVPDITAEQQVEVLQMSLIRLDMMMSVLSRVQELTKP